VCIGRRQAEQMLARGHGALVDGQPLREAMERLWPTSAWKGDPVRGRDGVLEDTQAGSGGSLES